MSEKILTLIAAQSPVKQEIIFTPTTKYLGDLECGNKYESVKHFLCNITFNLKVLKFCLYTLRLKLINSLTNPIKYV